MSFDFVSVILSVFVYGEITDFNLINFINISWLDNTKMALDKIATRVAKDVNKYLKKKVKIVIVVVFCLKQQFIWLTENQKFVHIRP